MPKICVTIAEKTKEALINSALLAKSKSINFIELRLDYLEKPDYRVIEELRRTVGIPIIATLRATRCSGKFEGDEKQRARCLKDIISYKPAYIDLEHDIPAKILDDLITHTRRNGVHIVRSYHDFKGETSEEELLRILNDFCRKYAYGKVVSNLQTRKDFEKLQRVGLMVQSQFTNYILLGIGPYGSVSRYLADTFGSSVVYTSLSKEKTIVEGMIDIDGYKKYTALQTYTKSFAKRAGIIGNPLKHTLSPPLFNEIFRIFNLKITYEPHELTDKEIPEFIKSARNPTFAGFNVTSPFKIEILKYIDELDNEAKEIGAVNTVINENGKLIGYNTDIYGIESALRDQGLGVRGQGSALLIGAGGAARAMLYYLRKNNIPTIVVTRNPRKYSSLKTDFSNIKNIVGFEYTKKCAENFDLIVNATPIGMKGAPESKLEFNETLFHEKGLFFDMVYNPDETELIKSAKSKNMKAIGGKEMFIYQAQRTLELLCGLCVSYSFTKEIYERFHKT